MAETRGTRVLILSASAGAGHMRAADALLAVFKSHPRVANGGDVQHWDMLKYTTKNLPPSLFQNVPGPGRTTPPASSVSSTNKPIPHGKTKNAAWRLRNSTPARFLRR